MRLNAAGKIDWSRAAVDASFARAPGGVQGSGPNPTDRGRPGVKHHLLVDGHGLPLAADVTADVQRLAERARRFREFPPPHKDNVGRRLQ